MTGQLEPYQSYQDSGVPWLGTIPSHWTIKRGKWLFQKMERPVAGTDEVVTCFRDGVVTLRKNRRVRGFTESLKEIGYQGIRRGDLVIHAMDAFAGAVGVSDSDGKGTPVYSVCKPIDEANPYYYAYIIREMSRNLWIIALAKGIRERSTDFRFQEFASLNLPCPPPAEQEAIVRYLDHVDRCIKRAIHSKQNLIRLLNEQKQAIIQQAVTRGLDPHVKLKPSGVEELGDVPENWDIVPLRYLGVKFGSGMTPRGGAKIYQESGVPLIRSQNVHFNGLVLNDVVYISEDIHNRMSGTHVKPGDVLINITGASIGRVCVAPQELGEANVNQHVSIIRPRKEIMTSLFLTAYLSSPHIQHKIKKSADGAAREGMPLKSMKSLLILVPPLNEQLCIMANSQKITENIIAAINIAQRTIDITKKYYARLIADVVTGKVDVRAAAAALPTVKEEPVALEELIDEVDEEETDDPEEDSGEEDA